MKDPDISLTDSAIKDILSAIKWIIIAAVTLTFLCSGDPDIIDGIVQFLFNYAMR